MARIRFTVARTYETGGPGKGPHFPEGHVLDAAGVAAALGHDVTEEYANQFLARWVNRGAAEYVDGRTPVTEPDLVDLAAKKGGSEQTETPVDFDAMTRAELDALAAERGVDVSGAHTKGDVIAALQKAEKIAAGDFESLTRAELDALAAERGVEIADAKNKGDVIAALQLAAEANKK